VAKKAVDVVAELRARCPHVPCDGKCLYIRAAETISVLQENIKELSERCYSTTFNLVHRFHQVTGAKIGDGEWPTKKEFALRYNLIEEELFELAEAYEANDWYAIADALADLDYVVNGAAVAFGIHLPTITKEVHRSNMTKLNPDGTPVLREDGKVLKGVDYERPKIDDSLMAFSKEMMDWYNG
jgi:predicted HAD superfamily Cof-like phosphohydrolase